MMQTVNLRRAVFLLLSAMVPTITAHALSPLDMITEAMEKEEHVPRKRARVYFKKSTIAAEYLIERVWPDRVHLTTRIGQSTQELYVVGGFTYWKEADVWHKSSTARSATPDIPSIAGLFKSQLRNVREGPKFSRAGQQFRKYSGNIAWPQWDGVHDGTLSLEVNASTGLPSRLTFSGTCGQSACSFDESITYDSGLQIEAPIN